MSVDSPTAKPASPADGGKPPTPQAADASSTPRAGEMSQWRLIRRAFARHRLGMIALKVLVVLYTAALFAEFVSVQPASQRQVDFAYAPPMTPLWTPGEGLHVPAVFAETDPQTLRRHYVSASKLTVPIRLLAPTEPYRLLGFIPLRHRLIGVDQAEWQQRQLDQPGRFDDLPTDYQPAFYPLGADRYGRCVFSRMVMGARVSLSIGLIGIPITFILGLTIGGVSGYVGGRTDTVIQRIIEVINAVPELPLWIALAAVFPATWSPLQTYFAITVMLALLGWTSLARVTRGKILSLREEDYATAARLMGASHGRILFRHLLPGFTSHVLVVLTLAIPTMILGETALSFLGIGLREPVVSWGVMLQDCFDVKAVRFYPWLLTPTLLIVLTVLAFNFVGDGMRDAADPYSSR